MEQDALMLFGPALMPLYEAAAGAIRARFPDATETLHKTQATFANRYGFAYIWPPVRRRKGWPKECVIVSFGLGHRAEDARIVEAVEPYPGRWTHHVLVSDVSEVDSQLMDWIAQAYVFSMEKGRRKT